MCRIKATSAKPEEWTQWLPLRFPPAGAKHLYSSRSCSFSRDLPEEPGYDEQKIPMSVEAGREREREREREGRTREKETEQEMGRERAWSG